MATHTRIDKGTCTYCKNRVYDCIRYLNQMYFVSFYDPATTFGTCAVYTPCCALRSYNDSAHTFDLSLFIASAYQLLHCSTLSRFQHCSQSNVMKAIDFANELTHYLLSSAQVRM
jgi:hypothetical protein